MNTWLRRIRGAVGMGLTWAFAWFSAGMALLLVVGPEAADVPFPLGFGLLGFLSGVSFSGVLGLLDGRRRFDEMSMPRFAFLGAAGSTALATVFVLIAGIEPQAMLLLGPVFGIAGATCAAGTLALARMAANQESLAATSKLDEVGLTDAERRELLGDR